MSRQIIRPDAVHVSDQWAPVIRAGDFIFVTSCAGRRPDGTLEDGIENQVGRAFSNIRASLEAAGASFSNVVRTKLILSDFNLYAGANEVYARTFSDTDRAARSTIESRALTDGELVRIEAIASLADKRHIVTPGMEGRRPGVASDVGSGPLVFMGGVVGNYTWDSDWQYGDTVEAQTDQMLSNLELRLKAAGLTLSHIVRVLLLLNDIEDSPVVMRKLRDKWAADIMPALMVLEQRTMRQHFKELVEMYCIVSRRTKTALDSEDVLPERGGTSVVKSGEFLFVSGMTGRDQRNRLPPTAEGQIRGVLTNMKTCLEGAGSSLHDTIRLFASFRDIADARLLDRVSIDYFEEHEWPILTAVEMAPATGEELVTMEAWCSTS